MKTLKQTEGETENFQSGVLTSPMPFKVSSAMPDWLDAPFWSRSKSSRRAKFFFRPQTPESPKHTFGKKKKSSSWQHRETQHTK